MQKIRCLMLMALSMLVLAACQSPFVADDPPLRLRTAADEYPVGAQVALTIDNRTERVLHAAHWCGGFWVGVQRRDAGFWRPVHGNYCQALSEIGSLPLTPGESVETRRVMVTEPGVYRLRVRVSDRSDMTKPRFFISNTFVVK